MNTANNKRRQMSCERIEREFIALLQDREIAQITVSDICKRTGLNRSTFYANYVDIYDLADHLRDKLEAQVNQLYENDMMDYQRLFAHIRENRLFYTTYFKLGYDTNHAVDVARLGRLRDFFPAGQVEYHIEFHRAGLNAVIKKWLREGCKESPEEMANLIKAEYQGRLMP